MFEAIRHRSSLLWLIICFAAFLASSAYLFNPNAAWNVLLASIDVPAPELVPRLDVSQISQFFDLLNRNDLGTYIYYEGVVDAIFYLSITCFFLVFFSIALNRMPKLVKRFAWILFLPIFLFGFEVLEALTLLTIPYLHPQTPGIWFLISDLSTLGKIISYLATFVVAVMVALWMLIDLFRKAT